MSCLKFLNVFASVFVTLIGCCLVGLVAAGYSKLTDARDNLKDVASVNYYATALFVAAIILVVFLLFGGICGVAGSIQQKPNTYCLLFYAIISLISAFWFLGIAIAAVQVPDTFFAGNCTTGDSFNNLNNYAIAANDNGICRTGCECYFPKSTDTTVYSAAQITQLATEAPSVTTSNDAQPVKSQSCPTSSTWNSTTTFTGGDSVMSYLETFVGCSQWCTDSSRPLLYYRFSSVNNGIPTGYCYDTLKTWVYAYSRTTYIVGFVMTGIAFVAFLLGCWLRKTANDMPDRVKNDGPSQMNLNY